VRCMLALCRSRSREGGVVLPMFSQERRPEPHSSRENNMPSFSSVSIANTGESPSPGRLVAVLLSAILAAGCAQQSPRGDTAPASAAGAPAPWVAHTSTQRWNEYTCELIARNQAGQFPAARSLAYVNLAINNAIVTARAKGIRPEGAAAGAAATTLVFFFPKDEPAITARLNGEMAALGAVTYRPDFAAGV